jgi:DNA-binding XRE family transcriptional regulator
MNRPWEKHEIAARFRSLRREAMFTQARLAQLIGICMQALNKIENRHTKPH